MEETTKNTTDFCRGGIEVEVKRDLICSPMSNFSTASGKKEFLFLYNLLYFVVQRVIVIVPGRSTLTLRREPNSNANLWR